MKSLQLCFAALLIAGCARADEITINLDAPLQNASPGDILTFMGTVTSNDVFTIDLNAVNVSIPGLFAADETPFITFGPPTVDGGQTTVDFTLFTVSVDNPYTDPSGIVVGTATVLGNVETGGVYDGNAQDFLGQTTFSVNVTAGTVGSVPEVSTVWMLLPALGLLFVVKHRRRAI
jgi:hypothetical protein